MTNYLPAGGTRYLPHDPPALPDIVATVDVVTATGSAAARPAPRERAPMSATASVGRSEPEPSLDCGYTYAQRPPPILPWKPR